MSDAPSSAPASALSGPASASDAQLTGRFADEAKNGYRSMPEPQKREEREFATGREAAEELAKKRKPIRNVDINPVQPVEYRDDRGRKISDKETITPERGADDLKRKRLTDASVKELTDRDWLARDIDNLRREAGVPTDPTAPVDPNQIDPHVFGDLPHQAPQIDPQHLPQDMRPQQPPPPGVDPEVHRAMQLPQVREHFEREHGKVTQLQQHHAQQVQVANDFAQAAFRSAVPELANLRTDQIVPFLNQMAKTNPPRFKQAMALLDNVTKANTARQQVEQQRAHAEKQEFTRYSKEHDAAFDRRMAAHTPEQRRAIGAELVSYAAELGVDQRTLTSLMATNPIMRHSAFQSMMADAAAHRLAQKSLATMRQQQRAANLPPVIRPGSGAPRTTVQSANLQSLSTKLSQTGDAKDAAALLIARRNAARR
jgi:hypothetical protein